MSMTVQVFAVPEASVSSFMADPSKTDEWLLERMFVDSEETLFLEKEWYGVDFILDLAGVSPALMNSGSPIGGDLGYGPPRLSSVLETRELSEKVTGMSDETAEQLFSFELFDAEAIYPAVWQRKNPADKGAILAALGELRAFLRRAASRSEGLLVALF